MAPASAGTGHAQHELSTRRCTPPPHFHNEVRLELNTRLSNRWIGRAGADDEELLRWTPRSSNLTPRPQTILDLRARITAAIETVDHQMLQRTWAEIDYWLDVCRVANGAHIEHL